MVDRCRPPLLANSFICCAANEVPVGFFVGKPPKEGRYSLIWQIQYLLHLLPLSLHATFRRAKVHGGKPKGIDMAIDLICAMVVDEQTARCADRDGQTLYVCSEHYRQMFWSQSEQTPRIFSRIIHRPHPRPIAGRI